MSILKRLRQRKQPQKEQVTAFDALQAVLLITKHLSSLLPFLQALRRVPAQLPQRVGLLQTIAGEIANDVDFARDWYAALGLLVGEDLGNRSVADLLALSVEHLGNGRLGDVWGTAYQIGLIDDEALQHWVLYEGLTNDATTRR